MGTLTPSLQKRFVKRHREWLQALAGETVVPLGYWLALRSVLAKATGVADPLFPHVSSLLSSGSDLPYPELRRLLAGETLGDWSLDAGTLCRIWRWLHQIAPPDCMLECGVGVSTLVLGSFLSKISHPRRSTVPLLLSLEQNLDVKQALEARVRSELPQASVRILHAPVSRTGEYQVSDREIASVLDDRRVDCLLIDGPLGQPGCRVSTLPRLAAYCRPNARWFLDDAFRDGELAILRRWSRLPGIRVDGIYPLGKGLATGVVSRPDYASRQGDIHSTRRG